MSISKDNEEINSKKDIKSKSEENNKDNNKIIDYYNDKNK